MKPMFFRIISSCIILVGLNSMIHLQDKLDSLLGSIAVLTGLSMFIDYKMEEKEDEKENQIRKCRSSRR